MKIVIVILSFLFLNSCQNNKKEYQPIEEVKSTVSSTNQSEGKKLMETHCVCPASAGHTPKAFQIVQ
uniref:hypothetical protein n=1 Tax=Flavobacterium sp. TaxID=239 RepID=UPI003BA78BE3